MPIQAQRGQDSARASERRELAKLVASRLREVFDRCGGVGEIHSRTGIPLRTLHNYVSETKLTEPKIGDLAIIAARTQVSLDWLVGAGGMNGTVHDPASGSGGFLTIAQEMAEFSLVPRYDIRASAGPGAVVPLEDIDGSRGFVAFRTDWLRRLGVNPKSAETIIAVGDSMEPTIRDGDLLLVDRSITRIVDNGIYVLTLGGMILLKRLQPLRDGSVMLKSDNPVYDDEVVPAVEVTDLRIEARVRWFGRPI